MNMPSLRTSLVAAMALLLLAACSSSTTTTWTIAPAAATPAGGASAAPSGAPASPGMSTAPSSPGASGAPGSAAPGGSPAAGQTIKLELTGALQITQGGQPVTELTVHQGETIHFVIDNTAGFTHNFHIGTADQLSQGMTGLPGITDWTSGVQQFDYVVTADTANLQFACIVPGHYTPMHGTFKVVP